MQKLYKSTFISRQIMTLLIESLTLTLTTLRELTLNKLSLERSPLLWMNAWKWQITLNKWRDSEVAIFSMVWINNSLEETLNWLKINF
jgi:hypothetical protein